MNPIHLSVAPEELATLEKEHDMLLQETKALAKALSEKLLILAQLPSVHPQNESITASCAYMLATLSREKEGLLPCLARRSKLVEKFENGKRARLDLEMREENIHLEGSVPYHCDCRKRLSPLFNEHTEGYLLRLSERICEIETVLSELALSAARTAKKIEKGELPQSHYNNRIDAARIQLHDIAMGIDHIRKEIDHVKIPPRL